MAVKVKTLKISSGRLQICQSIAGVHGNLQLVAPLADIVREKRSCLLKILNTMILDNCDSLCDSLLREDILSACQHQALALGHQQCSQNPE